MSEIPEGAKVPEDRKAKADPTAPSVIDFTVTGTALDEAGDPLEVPVSLDPSALDDFEVADKIGRITEASAGEGEPSDILLAGQLLRKLVGGVTFRALMDAHRDPETGRVPMEKGAEILMHVLESLPNS